MEIEDRRNIRDDRMSDCQSFGSNYNRCSQTRKISIGIMVDSSLKSKFVATKDKEVVVENAEKITSGKENTREETGEREGVRTPIRGKQAEVPEKENSPWISPRSVSPIVKTVHHAKQSSNVPANSDVQNMSNGENNLSKVHSSQFVAKDILNLQAGVEKQKKIERVVYKRRENGDGTAGRVEEFSFGTGHNISVSAKGATDDEANKTEVKSSETLKMKLWEILGTVASPDKSNSQSHEPDAISSKMEQACDAKVDTDVKSRQNSDTIETDSENLVHTIKRPVTCSVTRKRAPPKVKTIKARTSTRQKQNNQDKNIFYFEEGLPGSLPAVNGGSSVSKMKNERKISKIEPRKISFLKKEKADKISKVSEAKKIPLPEEKTSSLGSRMGGILAIPPQVKNGYLKPKTRSQENKNESNVAPVAKDRVPVREIDSQVSPENVDQHEDHVNPSLKYDWDQQEDAQAPIFGSKVPTGRTSPSSPLKTDEMDMGCGSPTSAKKTFSVGNISTFKFWQTSKQDIFTSNAKTETFGSKIPTERTSPSSPPKTDKIDMGCGSPISAKKTLTVGNISSFKVWQTSKEGIFTSNAQTESSDDEEGLKDSPVMNPVHSMEEKDELTQSPSQKMDSSCSEDDSPINHGYKDCSEDEKSSPEVTTAVRPKNIHHYSKRLRGHEGIKFNKFGPISPSPQGTDEVNGFCKPSEQDNDDGLSRAVTLFALALERLQNKVKSVTRNKCSEILMSAADGISMKMQSVQSQVQEDVGKLTSLTKSKRKRLETRFLEHQEKLKLIHEKFKEEINQYLQDCCSTLEGMEATKIESKGTIEKQKASHRKLLLKVEDAIGSQLNDAERRITTVHKVACERMAELKKVIAECLMEGVLE